MNKPKPRGIASKITEEEKKIIIELRGGGMKVNDIAKIVKKDPSHIARVYLRHNDTPEVKEGYFDVDAYLKEFKNK